MANEGLEVAVVDDEEWVRRGLVSKLSKSGLSFKALKEFAEGESVRQYIEEGGRLDIMVCDIRMPGADGLDLSSWVRDRLPEIRVIIVSGYSEFEYAKRAIQAGVSEYLVKPIDDIEFFVALKNCADSLTLSREHKERLAYLQNLERQNRARRCLGNGKENPDPERGGDPSDLKDLFPAYDKVLSRFIAVCFRALSVGEVDFHDLINCRGPEFLDNRSLENSVLYSCAPGEYTLLFLSLEPEDFIRDKIRELVLSVAALLREKEKSVAAGMSGLRDSPEQAVMEARDLMKYRALMETPLLICPGDAEGRTEHYRIAGHHLSALQHALQEGKENVALAVLDTLEGEINSLNLSYRCLENAYLQLLTQVSLFGARNWNLGLFLKDPYKLGDLKSIFDFLKELYREYAVSSGQPETGGKAALIRAIASSIDEHYREYLTLDLFAADYKINASYLSLLFKEIIGVNFQEYLSQVRIRNAKKFLASGRYKISEVAEMAGFTSRFYFSKAFKKIEGLTPREFINRTPPKNPGPEGE